MSNCSNLINTVYKSRHDNSIKCFVFPLLKQLGLGDKGKPYYENESSKFWWDIPEYTGKENDYIMKPLTLGFRIIVHSTIINFGKFANPPRLIRTLHNY